MNDEVSGGNDLPPNTQQPTGGLSQASSRSDVGAKEAISFSPSKGDTTAIYFWSPLGVSFIVLIVALWVIHSFRETITAALEIRTTLRRVLHLIFGGFVPLASGVLCDVIDFTDMFAVQQATLAQSTLLYLAGLLWSGLIAWFFLASEYETTLEKQNATLSNQLETSSFLVRHYASLMLHLRAYLDSHKLVLDEKSLRIPDDVGHPSKLAEYPGGLFSDNLVNLCTAVQDGVASSLRVGGGHRAPPSVSIAMFRRRTSTSLIEHVWSRSTETNFAQHTWVENPSHFDMESTKESCVKSALRSNDIVVTEDCEKSHADDKDPFYYFGTTPDARMKSLVTIPIRNVDGEAYCVCISASQPMVFRKDEESMVTYRSLQDEIRARLLLLHSQRRFLEGFVRGSPAFGGTTPEGGGAGGVGGQVP